ncbi:MAG TPA: YihY/virulence factor BrkB family protein [Abditibacteriaceae bacterium]|jgi:membrane protein
MNPSDVTTEKAHTNQSSTRESTLPAPLQTLADRAPALARVVQFGWRLSERWGFDHCPLIAAALAFFGLLSLFPILLAALAILGNRLVQHPNELQSLQNFIRDFFPGGSGALLQERLDEQIKILVDSPAAPAVGIVSVLSLLWSGRAYFDTLASVLNSIWPNATPRTFLQHQIALWSTLAGAGVLFVLSSAATFGLSLARSLSDHVPAIGRVLDRQPFFWSSLAWSISWLLTLFMFWTIYRFLPNAQPGRRGRIALGSALVASVGWELAKWAFTHFLSDTARYGAVYGSVGSVVITMMWLYTSSMVILLGAEASAAYLETRAAARGEAKPTQDKLEDSGQALPQVGPAAAPDVEVRTRSKDREDLEGSSAPESTTVQAAAGENRHV